MLHTLGPLAVKEVEIRGVKKFEIRAGVQTGYQRVAVVDFEPDARLIAAAPELLEALRALLSRLDEMTTEDFSKGGEKHEREQVRALLARIEGKEG